MQCHCDRGVRRRRRPWRPAPGDSSRPGRPGPAPRAACTTVDGLALRDGDEPDRRRVAPGVGDAIAHLVGRRRDRGGVDGHHAVDPRDRGEPLGSPSGPVAEPVRLAGGAGPRRRRPSVTPCSARATATAAGRSRAGGPAEVTARTPLAEPGDQRVQLRAVELVAAGPDARPDLGGRGARRRAPAWRRPCGRPGRRGRRATRGGAPRPTAAPVSTTGAQSAVRTASVHPGVAVTAASASAPACSPGRDTTTTLVAVHLAQPGPGRGRADGAVGPGPRSPAKSPSARVVHAERTTVTGRAVRATSGRTGRRSRRRRRGRGRRRHPRRRTPVWSGAPRCRRCGRRASCRPSGRSRRR